MQQKEISTWIKCLYYKFKYHFTVEKKTQHFKTWTACSNNEILYVIKTWTDPAHKVIIDPGSVNKGVEIAEDSRWIQLEHTDQNLGIIYRACLGPSCECDFNILWIGVMCCMISQIVVPVHTHIVHSKRIIPGLNKAHRHSWFSYNIIFPITKLKYSAFFRSIFMCMHFCLWAHLESLLAPQIAQILLKHKLLLLVVMF